MLQAFADIAVDYIIFIAFFILVMLWFVIKKIFLKGAQSEHTPPSSSADILLRAEEKALRVFNSADARALKIVEEADKRAVMIVGDADKRAAEIIHSAELSGADIRKLLEISLQEVVKKESTRLSSVSDELLASYRTSADKAQQAYMRTLEVASNTITGDAREGMLRFQKFLEEEMARQQNLLTQFIQERRDGVLRDIVTYKKSSLQKIDESIYGILLLVSKEVLGKTVDTETHQELIMHALDSAKKENFFTI